MKIILRTSLLACLLLFGTALARAQADDSLEILTNVGTVVQLKLDQFVRTNADYQLLLDAQKISASLNPPGRKTALSALAEGSLRLRLKVLLALAGARDPHYDPHAPTNTIYLNLASPNAPGTVAVPWPSGIDPKDIPNPAARQAYEDALAGNDRRREKLKRERDLARGEDMAVRDIWIFVHKGFLKNSAAQKSALNIIGNTVFDGSILNRLQSDTAPVLLR